MRPDPARAPARPSRIRAFALALLLLAGGLGAALSARATVYTSFDFETPGYGGNGRRMSDHTLLKVGAIWHLFYTELATTLVPATRIGHAVSTDLTHWTERPTVLVAGGKSWFQKGVWAPQVSAAPGGGWVMLFSGKSDLGSEAIGALTSGDLDSWLMAPESPVFAPTTAWARWGSDINCSCRDPFVYFENGVYNLLYTVGTSGAPGYPALGRAESLDLIHWNDMGPFAIDSTFVQYSDIESPSLVFRANRVELHFTRYHAQMLTASTSAGPWNLAEPLDVDPRGGASEIALDGPVSLLSRVRFDACNAQTSLIVIDTVTTTAIAYNVPGPAGLSAAWISDGDAFTSQPTYSDGPRLRGETPALPEGLRWLGTGESLRQAGETSMCISPEFEYRTGTLRSPRFMLLGDVLAFKLSGGAAIDSTYLALVDDCTGQELARAAGPGTSALTPLSWSNTGRRGWPVRLQLADLATGPGGFVGLDAVRDSSVGSPAAPTQPLIDETAPAGGENLTPGSTFTIRYTGSAAAGVDSFLVLLSYDDFATMPTKLARRNANQLAFNWTVPAGPKFNAKIRLVIFAKNAVHACDQSNAFTIGVTTGVGDPPAAALALAARGQPGRSPVLDWSAPGGERATLALYDVRGRQVRQLYDGPGAEHGRSPWDGLDDAGRLTPSGIYFARLESGGKRVSAHLVRLAR